MCRYVYKQHMMIGLFVFFHCSLFAQGAKDSLDSRWSFSLSGYYYFIPDDQNTITLIGTADHKKLHIETRYNYEDQNTGSVFAGWRFERNGKVQFEVIPMAGIAFGNTNGIVPAVELSVAYKMFDYYSETEFVFDLSGNENNFFYVWGELAISPFRTLRTGFVYQKTRLYQTAFDVQGGLFATWSFWKITAGGYYFNPFSDSNFFSMVMSIDF